MTQELPTTASVFYDCTFFGLGRDTAFCVVSSIFTTARSAIGRGLVGEVGIWCGAACFVVMRELSSAGFYDSAFSDWVQWVKSVSDAELVFSCGAARLELS